MLILFIKASSESAARWSSESVEQKPFLQSGSWSAASMMRPYERIGTQVAPIHVSPVLLCRAAVPALTVAAQNVAVEDLYRAVQAVNSFDTVPLPARGAA